MFSTYRGKLAASFSLFVLLCLIITAICLIYNSKVRKLDSLTIEAERTYRSILMDQKILGDFFTMAPSSSPFHRQRSLPVLDYHKKLKSEIIQNLHSLESSIELELREVPQSISPLKELIQKNDDQLDEINSLLWIRGFKTHGVEGKMRLNIHKLEIIPGFKKEEVLSLRRREKDYIIRNDKKYVKLLIAESNKMLQNLEQNPKLNPNQKELAAYHLRTYVANFKQLVDLEDILGINNNTGLKHEFNQTQTEIKASLEQGISEIEQSKTKYLNWFSIVLGCCLIFLLIIGLYLGFYLSKSLTFRITWLSKRIDLFVKNDFQEKTEEKAIPQHKADEIGDLIKNYSYLKTKISNYIFELRKEKEAADLANQSKSLFLANMSHEIRTPMNGVLGITQLLESSEMDAGQKHYVDILKVSGNKLLGIINDILDFSKIEAGELKLEETKLSIKDEIFKVYKILSLEAENKKLDFQLNIDPKMPKNLLGDPVRLNQIIFNLVGNAIKFTDQGFVIVNAGIIKEDNDKITIKLVVEDSGIGISQEAQEFLFSAFSQADESTTRRFGGTGLGLTIASELVKLMGGEIAVASELGIGSIFTATLEFKKEKKSIKPSKLNQADNSLSQKVKVLIVEDNEINQRIVQMMLKKLGYETNICTNGQEALKEVLKNLYDLILMDIQMPIMDGFTATEEIRKLQDNGTIPGFPIIALTANATEADRQTANRIGMDEFLTKPIKLEKLKEVLTKYTMVTKV